MKFLYFIILAVTAILNVNANHLSARLYVAPDNGIIGEKKNSTTIVEHIREATFNKYARVFSKSESIHKRAVKNVPLKIEGQDTSYFAKLKVGNQIFNILLDTGSSNLWIPNKNCTAASCVNHHRFDPSKSKTFIKRGDKWNITYGIGFASGVTGIDDVTLGGITAKKVLFGLADLTSDDDINLISDGVCGLAFDVLNSMGGKPTLISTMVKQHKIDPIFSIYLSRFTNFDDVGILTLGGIDKAKFKGKITFSPVIEAKKIGLWIVKVDDLVVNNKAVGFKRKFAITDTGTSVSFLPPADAAELHKQIPGAEENTSFYTIPCNTKAKVQIKISGVKYTISHADLVIPGLTLEDGSGSICVSSFLPGAISGENLWLLGTPFLKNVYSVYDVKNERLGLATVKKFIEKY